MDIRKITDSYSVTPQITPEDLAAIRAAGFGTVICNRPDSEVPADLNAETMRAAAQAAGLQFHDLPLTHDTMTPQRIAEQRAICDDADEPVLAYCASGTRCTVVWALGQAGQRPVDEILSTAQAAGYDLAPLRPRLEERSSQAGT
ncbi:MULTISPECIES: TIGR01244 family sulfur transferase [Sediminimonas]|uniref:TIGR01244 family sulfur transferase n=1 Tax=Sediminimonas TaxID=659427 RepID=UPI0003FFF9A3|nr:MULTISPECIES: TIGR01244 family sulfur transferase [Sediminimonas]MDR9485584.1 TIGR01244 family sulfur transferase [Sediminimonas sp.]